jgi:shikimate dehydrogenase
LGLSGWTYDRLESDAAGLADLVASLGDEWAGLSVTMPGKHAALALAASATDRAIAVGAANTLVHQPSGEWHADCTDVDGVVGALRSAGGFTGGSVSVVLGAGGTACAALAGLAELGVGEVSIVVRDPARAGSASACAERLGLHVEIMRWSTVDFGALASQADVLISTTPASAIEDVVEELASARCVLDVIYHPWPTALATAVSARGGQLANGLDMLLHQAFSQVEQLTGQSAPRFAMRDALRAATGAPLPLPVTDAELQAATVGDLAPYAVTVVIEDYSPEWPNWFADDEGRIDAALGDVALRIEHTGSTSVPGLPAKPVIDILLLVPDPTDETSYVPALERAGYLLRAREPHWYEHRLFHRRGAPHDVNIHVFAPGIAEVDRILRFRDWLRTHPTDRDHYAAVKRDLASRKWKYVQNYADAKTTTIEQILTRATSS